MWQESISSGHLATNEPRACTASFPSTNCDKAGDPLEKAQTTGTTGVVQNNWGRTGVCKCSLARQPGSNQSLSGPLIKLRFDPNSLIHCARRRRSESKGPLSVRVWRQLRRSAIQPSRRRADKNNKGPNESTPAAKKTRVSGLLFSRRRGFRGRDRG